MPDKVESSRDSSLKIEKMLMTYDELADEFGCTRRHLEKLVKAGKLPAPTKLGRSVRFNTDVIKKWLKKQGA